MQTVVVLGAGPSLCAEDVDRVLDAPDTHVIAVNDAWRLTGRRADILYAADAQWWRWLAAANVTDDQLPPVLLAAQPDAKTYRPSVQILTTKRGDGISLAPGMIYSGGHGGHQAINVAALLWPSRIVLLGFDMQADPATGQHHFFGEHPYDVGHQPPHCRYGARLKSFEGLRSGLDAVGIQIINCSRRTAIDPDVIPRGSLAEVLR
jgi:hypothetical protein